MSDASILLNMYRYTGGRGSGRECRDVELYIETALASGIYDS